MNDVRWFPKASCFLPILRMSGLMASRSDLRIFSMSDFWRERPPRPVAFVYAGDV